MAEVLRSNQELRKEEKLQHIKQNNLLRHQAMEQFELEKKLDQEKRIQKKYDMRRILD